MKHACELTSDRDTANAELPAVAEYLDKLNGVCVAKTMTYEEKTHKRAGELSGTISRRLCSLCLRAHRCNGARPHPSA